MRRNRQKLHRELRLKAEADKRRRREARQQKKAARAAAIAAAERVLRSRVSRRRGQTSDDAVLSAIRELLRLAEAPSSWARRVVRVFRAVRDELPELATVDQLPWFCLLSAAPWVRTPETWTRPSGSVARKRDHLARHLLTRFPVPPFLLRALDVDALAVARIPVEDQWAVQLLSHVGRGESLRTAVGTEVLPAPLTRKMVHLLLSANASATPVSALRSAQVAGFGGPARLARTLLATRLGGLRGSDPVVGEPFWHEVIGWLCRTQGAGRLTPSELEDVLGWFELRQRRDGPVCLKGRTLRAIRRDIADQRLGARRASEDDFPESGLLPLDREDGALRPIETAASLNQGANALGNCAWQYRRLLRQRKVALFALQREGDLHAMVEVSLGAARVVQARRAYNRPLLPEDQRLVRDWARLNRLQVAI